MKDPQSCKHEQWVDNSEPYEEHIVIKCSDCGIFQSTNQPNPKFDQAEADEEEKHFYEHWFGEATA